MSTDARVDEQEAIDMVRTMQDSNLHKLRTTPRQPYYSSMPKSWSNPPVDFEKLIKQTEGQNLIGCLSGPEGYKGLLLEIGTFSESELEQIEKAIPSFKEQEDKYKQQAKLWLQNESNQLQDQDEHIKIHVETTCLPIPTETPKMEIRATPLKSSSSADSTKQTRVERRIDPELQKLKCGQGGAYRWSMSKQSFNKVVCPFCIRSEDPSKSGLNVIRADYWRRHITEVHKKENEIEHSKNLVICLKCYHIGIDKAKEAKQNGVDLPDFSSLFFTNHQRKEHEEAVHKGERITFVSAWEKKEASHSRRKRTSVQSEKTPPAKTQQQPLQLSQPQTQIHHSQPQQQSHHHTQRQSQLPQHIHQQRPQQHSQQHQHMSVKLEPEISPINQMRIHHHPQHQQIQQHQLPQRHQQRQPQLSNLQIMPNMTYPSIQTPQPQSSPIVKQEIKQEYQDHMQTQQQCLNPSGNESRHMMVDSASLNAVADQAFNFTINADASLNLDIDTSFSDFDIALHSIEPTISLNSDVRQQQQQHHQLMSRQLPKADVVQTQPQRIPQILHNPQVHTSHSNMPLMSPHRMQNNPHMMQVDHPMPGPSIQPMVHHSSSPQRDKPKQPSQSTQRNMPAQSIQEILVKTEDNDHEEREAERQRKKERMPKLKCERGEVYVWNARQFYQKIICPMCDERGGGCKELTVPHFRKHLEQVHTIEEIEKVQVCKLCHRNSVAAKVDNFRGLVTAKDVSEKQDHYEKAHQGVVMKQDVFISIFQKQRKSTNDDWGLDGVERDPQKVYKYATKRRKEEMETMRVHHTP